MIPIYDMQVLISPQFTRAVMYYLIMSFNYMPNIDKVFEGGIKMSQVRLDKIKPDLRNP
jgi:hypothetical protein